MAGRRTSLFPRDRRAAGPAARRVADLSAERSQERIRELQADDVDAVLRSELVVNNLCCEDFALGE